MEESEDRAVFHVLRANFSNATAEKAVVETDRGQCSKFKRGHGTRFDTTIVHSIVNC